MKLFRSIVTEQHNIIERNLVRLNNILINRDKSPYDSKKILQDLIDYFDIHFYIESIFLKRSGLKESIVNYHISQHVDFFNKIKSLSEKESIIVDLIMILKDWEKEHINKYDHSDIGVDLLDGTWVI